MKMQKHQCCRMPLLKWIFHSKRKAWNVPDHIIISSKRFLSNHRICYGSKIIIYINGKPEQKKQKMSMKHLGWTTIIAFFRMHCFILNWHNRHLSFTFLLFFIFSLGKCCWFDCFSVVSAYPVPQYIKYGTLNFYRYCCAHEF